MINCILNNDLMLFQSKFQDIWLEKGHPYLNRLTVDVFLILGEYYLLQFDQIDGITGNQLFTVGTNVIQKMGKLVEVSMNEIV
jgi:hypothetical protein